MLCLPLESRKKDVHFYKVLINLLESGGNLSFVFLYLYPDLNQESVS
jgi:hypothetical protein